MKTLIGITFLVGALLAVIPPAGAYGGPVAVAAGDSITVLSTPDIVADMSPFFGITVVAHSGYTIDQQYDDLSLVIANDHPEVVIVNLGTNDVGRDNTHAVADLDAMARMIANDSVPCVAFYTINEVAGLGQNTLAEQLDAAIKSYPSTYGFSVIDWNAVLGANLDFLSPYDGIHPTALGQAWIGSHDAAFAEGCA